MKWLNITKNINDTHIHKVRFYLRADTSAACDAIGEYQVWSCCRKIFEGELNFIIEISRAYLTVRLSPGEVQNRKESGLIEIDFNKHPITNTESRCLAHFIAQKYVKSQN